MKLNPFRDICANWLLFLPSLLPLSLPLNYLTNVCPNKYPTTHGKTYKLRVEFVILSLKSCADNLSAQPICFLRFQTASAWLSLASYRDTERPTYTSLIFLNTNANCIKANAVVDHYLEEIVLTRRSVRRFRILDERTYHQDTLPSV